MFVNNLGLLKKMYVVKMAECESVGQMGSGGKFNSGPGISAGFPDKIVGKEGTCLISI